MFPLSVLARGCGGGRSANGDVDGSEDGQEALSPPRGMPNTTPECGAALRELLRDKLLEVGAVHVRGLPLSTADDFSGLVDSLGWDVVKLGGGGTERSTVSRNVRTASNEPPQQTIEPHMDMAHSTSHPKRIAFFALAGPPPGVGGETVLTDMRAVYRALDEAGIVGEFARRGGVAYHKRLWSRERVDHTYTWQQFFFTEDLAEATRMIRELDPTASVSDDGRIDYQEVLDAVYPHPHTGEPLWFNGVHTNHHSYYEEGAHIDTSDGPPMDTTFADGTAIPVGTIATIRAAFWNNSVASPLRDGDVVFVDNMLASHGRMGWVPGNPRKVLLTHFSGGPL